MDGKELEEGMKDAKKDAGKESGAGKEEWSPDIDWVLKSVGPFFNNNAGLGELLLDKLSESGVNTQAAALAAMVDVLQQFNREYKELGEALGQNIDRIDELSSQSEDLAKAVEDLLKEMGGDTDNGPGISLDDGGGAMPPPEDGAAPDAGAPPDMGTAPPDMGVPPDMGAGAAPPDMGAAPPDMGGGMPLDTGAMPPGMGAAPPDMGGGMPPDMGGPVNPNIVSDDGMKDVKKYVLSDEQLKNIAGRLAGAYRKRIDAGRNTKLSPNIIGACARSDL